MITRTRGLAAASAIVLLGVGTATTVGQVRARRRARDYERVTLPLIHGMEARLAEHNAPPDDLLAQLGAMMRR